MEFNQKEAILLKKKKTQLILYPKATQFIDLSVVNFMLLAGMNEFVNAVL